MIGTCWRRRWSRSNSHPHPELARVDQRRVLGERSTQSAQRAVEALLWRNPKPAREPYAQMIREHDVDPTRAVMLEDIARNLEPAHELGMTTVWIRSEHDHSAMGADGDHIHHVIDDLVEWLEEQIE